MERCVSKFQLFTSGWILIRKIALTIAKLQIAGNIITHQISQASQYRSLWQPFERLGIPFICGLFHFPTSAPRLKG